MLESAISTKLRKEMEALGAVVWKVSDRFHASRPDLLVFYDGRCMAIEVKVHPNKPTKLQEHTLIDLFNAGINAYVATYYPLTKTLLITYTNTLVGPTPFFDIRKAAQWLLQPPY